MSHVFVSYSKKDKDYVLKFVDRLLDEGFDVWIDNRGLKSSEDWWRSIVVALRECSAFVVVLTPNSDASDWVQLEVTLATKYKKARFPILLEGSMDTPNWEIFARTQYVDVTDGSLPQGEFYNLLGKQAVRKSYRGKALSDTGRLEQKVGPFVGDDPIMLEAISSPPLKMDEGDDVDLSRFTERTPISIPVTQAPAKPETQSRISQGTQRLMIAIGALVVVLLGIIAVVVTPKQGQTPTNTPTSVITLTATNAATATTTVTATAQTLTATTVIDLAATPANVESLNNWLGDNGHTPFKENSILSELAQRQRSYLMSLSVPDFNALDSLVRDRDGRDAQEMAKAMGYKGDVQMIVEVAPSVVMLKDILEKIETSGDNDVYSRFHEIGIDFQSSLTTDPVKVFFVLVLGTGSPS